MLRTFAAKARKLRNNQESKEENEVTDPFFFSFLLRLDTKQ